MAATKFYCEYALVGVFIKPQVTPPSPSSLLSSQCTSTAGKLGHLHSFTHHFRSSLYRNIYKIKRPISATCKQHQQQVQKQTVLSFFFQEVDSLCILKLLYVYRSQRMTAECFFSKLMFAQRCNCLLSLATYSFSHNMKTKYRFCP